MPNLSKKGFTLIEVMIAVVIFVSSLLFILPQINRSENQIKKTLRELKTLNRTLHSYAQIYNRTYRLALQTDPLQSSYWVEVKRITPLHEMDPNPSSEDTNEPAPHPFFEKNTDLSDLKTLPLGLHFEKASSTDSTKDDGTSILYITYSPHFIFPSQTVRLKKKAPPFQWNLVFNSIQGELEIDEEL